jgi:hypothetical protein
VEPFVRIVRQFYSPHFRQQFGDRVPHDLIVALDAFERDGTYDESQRVLESSLVGDLLQELGSVSAYAPTDARLRAHITAAAAAVQSLRQFGASLGLHVDPQQPVSIRNDVDLQDVCSNIRSVFLQRFRTHFGNRCPQEWADPLDEFESTTEEAGEGRDTESRVSTTGASHGSHGSPGESSDEPMGLDRSPNEGPLRSSDDSMQVSSEDSAL